MAQIPITNAKLPQFTQGAEFAYVITFSVDALLPDPNTWTNCRLSITIPSGSSGTPVVVSKSAFLSFVITGSGPWTVVATIRLTQSQTLGLPVALCPFQIDFTTGVYRDVLVTSGTNGGVNVLAAVEDLE